MLAVHLLALPAHSAPTSWLHNIAQHCNIKLTGVSVSNTSEKGVLKQALQYTRGLHLYVYIWFIPEFCHGTKYGSAVHHTSHKMQMEKTAARSNLIGFPRNCSLFLSGCYPVWSCFWFPPNKSIQVESIPSVFTVIERVKFETVMPDLVFSWINLTKSNHRKQSPESCEGSEFQETNCWIQ